MIKRCKKRRYFKGDASVSRDCFIETLRGGAIGVLATDTVYGIVCRAENQSSVERAYAVRKRDMDKACIVLIACVEEIERFGVCLNAFSKRLVDSVWPGPVSVIFPCLAKDRWAYLHRGTEKLAFRVPKNADMRELLERTGPLIAPSANIQNFPVAETFHQARDMFGDTVDVWEDAGRRKGKSSTLIACEKGGILLRREGQIPFGEIVRNING